MSNFSSLQITIILESISLPQNTENIGTQTHHLKNTSMIGILQFSPVVSIEYFTSKFVEYIQYLYSSRVSKLTLPTRKTIAIRLEYLLTEISNLLPEGKIK